MGLTSLKIIGLSLDIPKSISVYIFIICAQQERGYVHSSGFRTPELATWAQLGVPLVRYVTSQPSVRPWRKDANKTFFVLWLLDPNGKHSKEFSPILTNTNHLYMLPVESFCNGLKLGFPTPISGKKKKITSFPPWFSFTWASPLLLTKILHCWHSITKCVAVIFSYRVIICNMSCVFYNLTQFHPELVSDFMG